MADSTIDATGAAGQDPSDGKPVGTNHVVPNEPKQITLTLQQLTERLERAKPADYDDLKAKAARLDQLEAANKTEIEKATDALQAAQSERDSAKSEALRFRIATKHGISDEDAELFLTGTDESTLTKQAERLAGRELDRKKNGNRAPNEGATPPAAGSSDERQFVTELFGR